MKKHSYAVIGLGRFGSALARELVQLGYEVLGIDKNEERIDNMSEYLTHVAVADSIDEETLRSLGIRNFDCVVVAIGNDIQASIMTTIILKDMGIKKVVTKAQTKLHGKVLQKIGVDRVVFPERDMGIRVAHQLVTPNLLDYIELSKEYTIAELNVSGKISGHSLKELDTRARYGCSIVAIINKKVCRVNIAPSAEDQVEEGDVMVVIGTNEQIDRFDKAIHG
jgi:trk system potassium uptake protein TrkA